MEKKKTAKPKTGKKTKQVKPGDKLTCSVCGLMITIDEACGCVDMCDIICCGKQMDLSKQFDNVVLQE